MDFDAFVKDITDNKWNVFGAELYSHGQLIHSFGDTEGLHDLYSMTKTVLSVAFGIAYDEGVIKLDDSVLKYLPTKYTDALSEKQASVFREITLRRLLTMSVPGFPFRAEGDDWIEYALQCSIEDVSDRTFNYNNINAYLVGVCLTEALEKDLGAFIEERIFAPLEITDFEYKRSPEGYFYGASGMKLSVHDVVKFGLLLKDGGVYNGTRILSEEYVNMATSIQQMNREGGYGFFIWKYRSGFSINGKCKQKCYILPDKDLVLCYLSYIDDDSHDLIESAEKHILL
ncbi:MAG: serine hydrolase [Clostridiales bacterium]|nr:serine hydrolase [Clostridiales bacterium]MBR4010566.1 serine hydrolase [Clostridiales bacterium]